jgi:hypothetical protein
MTTDPQSVYNVRDFVDVATMKSDLSYSLNNLSDAMVRQASMFAHYGVLAADAGRQVDTVKLLLENTEAAIYQIIRNEKDAAAEKYTETLLERLISRHPRVIAMKKALNEAKRVEGITKTAMEAFRHRRDMLVQQGLISREEMKGEVAIAQRNAREDVQALQKSSYMDRIKSKNSE